MLNTDMKKYVYLDTTIPSYYFDSRDSVQFQSEITKKWFKEGVIAQFSYPFSVSNGKVQFDRNC